MQPPEHRDHLTDKRYVTLILRLLLDERRQLVSGEVTDVTSQQHRRFSGWQQLTQAVRTLLAEIDRRTGSSSDT